MHIFEFKVPGAPAGSPHFFINLAELLVVSGLTYTEVKFEADNGFGPGSGYIRGGKSSGRFTLTMALRTDLMEVAHGGHCQPDSKIDSAAFAKQQGLTLDNSGLRYHSPEVKLFAKYLNELPEPFLGGRAFKAEYERLLEAWKYAASQKA